MIRRAAREKRERRIGRGFNGLTRIKNKSASIRPIRENPRPILVFSFTAFCATAIPNPQQALSRWPNLPPSRTPRDLLWSRHGNHSLPPLRRDVATHCQNADAVRRAPTMRSLPLALSSRPRRRLRRAPATATPTVAHPCRSTKGGCVKCLPPRPAPNAIRLPDLAQMVKRSRWPTK